MKRRKPVFDAFIVGGFVSNLFYGYINPIYVSLILARLDSRIIAAGSLVSAAFPFFMGVLFENRRLFRRLLMILPAVMLAEVIAATASIAVAAVDVELYYLFAMLIMGIFSSSVLYLLQKLKERRYRRGRAVLDRRCGTADALGFLTGSALSMAGLLPVRDAMPVVALSVLQTALVYLIFLFAFRKNAARRRRKAEEDPGPWLRRLAAPDPAFAPI